MRYVPLTNKKDSRRFAITGSLLFVIRPPAGRIILVLLLLGLLLGWLNPSAAQAQSAAYWQFSAAASVHHVLNSDLRGDGVDEILIVTQNGQVDLLNADGSRHWSFTTGEPVYAAAIINESNPQPEVVLGLHNRLLLLDADGQLVAEISLTFSLAPLNLLTSGGAANAQSWQEQRQTRPLAIAPLRINNERQDILVLLQNGQVERYDRQGRFLWHHQEPGIAPGDTGLRLLVDDMDGNGQDEILLGFFDTRLRFSRLVRLNPEDGRPVWSQSISGRLTSATMIQFKAEADHLSATPPPRYVAVGNGQGQVLLYDKAQNRHWLRTANRPVTALASVPLAEGQALAVGTEVGSVIVYNEYGRRLWTNNLAPDANRRILTLSAPPLAPLPNQPSLAALLVSASDEQNADMILLAQDGRILSELANVDTQAPFSRLVDVNRDRHSEMLLLRFPNIELLGLGIGVADNAKEWEYSLGTRPTAQLVADLDRDGEDELLVGGEDGRLHRLRNYPTSSGLHRWVTDYDLPITHLALLPPSGGSAPDIIIIRYRERDGSGEGRLERRRADSHLLWTQPLQAPITSLLISNINETSEPEILVGTQQGQLTTYTSNGERLWSLSLDSENGNSVSQLLMLPQPDPQGARLIAVSGERLLKLRRLSQNPQVSEIMRFDSLITHVHSVTQEDKELAVRYLVLVEDGRLHGLNWRGIEMTHLGWPAQLRAGPTLTQPAVELLFESVDLAAIVTSQRESFLIATDGETLHRFNITDNSPSFSWNLTGLGQITSFYWDDLDGDSQPDLVVGNSQGQVRLYTNVQGQIPLLNSEIDLFSSIQAINVLQRRPIQRADLLILTENGLVQLFRAQENRPPLLTKPTAEASMAQYTISVSVLDVEQNEVDVRLELYDPDSEEWLVQETRRARDGRGELFWSIINPPVTNDIVRYRFHYNDGTHQGIMEPSPGPSPIRPVNLWDNMPFLLLLLGAAGGIAVTVLLRQAQTPSARANRFFRRLQQLPSQVLPLVEQKYAHTGGSPDFLLYLANRARQEGDWLIAGLADGLFLLADRPQAGLSIITSVLEEAGRQQLAWHDLERWQLIYSTGQKLLEAPSITELSLLRPELVHLLEAIGEREIASPALDELLPVLTGLRDSERVELFEDRLVYLHEAGTRLQRLQERANTWLLDIERTLVAVIARRWSGLVSAEIEELRGRAEVMVRLKTKRLVPNGRTDVSLEIYNSGRAPAENLLIALDDNPAYRIHSAPQTIPILPSGRSRQVNFAIEPLVTDRFRLALSLTYDDRNQQDKQTAFGDMVHLLPPVRDFRPIVNPYVPGTPLRQNSSLFYGRERLFNFIAENAGRVAQRNILILVGQRRTGKTSALLRLPHHLPEHLVPVYIDCQSLGVTPGMPAMFYELAWQIADALLLRNIEVAIPPLPEWEQNPTAVLERYFFPLVREKMPEPMMLLLVFDEFEAFENLVEDGILPPTLFPYLRHLMQHSERLSFIFVGTRRLEEMSADYWSVLFNIALYQRIGYLSEEAATRLVLEPVAPGLIYDDLALDKVLRVTAGHPYFLQLVCYTLVKRANAQRNGYVTISDVNATLDEMLSLGEVHFAYLWQRSSRTERALITAVSHLMDRHTAFHPEDLTEYLAQYDFKLQPAEVTAALNRLVERDIMREVPEGATTLYELRIGLVGLWTAKNKSLSRLYASES
jgi:outer membrane protein assembly factor BamB